MGVRYIDFCRSDYKENGEYNDYFMWQDISKTLEILTKNKYVCSFKHIYGGIYRIEFEAAAAEIAHYSLDWLTEEEADMVEDYRITQKETK